MEVKLARLSYAEISERLKNRASFELLDLLDDRSIKVGDTAASLLSSREEREMVLSVILNDKLKTRKGKVRALNFLSQCGRQMPEAIQGFLHLVNDLHPDVVDCALFGIVFWNDPRNIDAVLAITNPRVQLFVEKALKALQCADPSIYSPSFFDQAGVWSSSTKVQQVSNG